MGKRDKKDKKKKRRKDKDRSSKKKDKKDAAEEVAELVSDEEDSGRDSPSQLLLKRSKGGDTSDVGEPRRKRRKSSSKSSRSSSHSRSRSRSRSASAHSSSLSRSPSPKRRDRDRLNNDEKKRVEALRKRVYQRDPKENGGAGSGRKKKRNRNRFADRRSKFDRSRKVWGLDDDFNADARGRSRSVSAERRRRERNRSGSSDYSRSPANGRKSQYLDEVRDENGRIDKKKVLEIAKRNASLGQLENILTAGALAPEIAKLKSQSSEIILNYVQKIRDIPDDVPKPSTSAPAAVATVEATPVSSDEEEKEERFKRMTEKRKAAMKSHEEDDLPIVARKPFEVKKPLMGLSGIKINIANANALPTKTARERIQEEAKLRAALAPPPSSNPLHEWIPVVKEKEPQPAKKKDLAPPPSFGDSFSLGEGGSSSFLPPPPVPPTIDMMLPPPPVPPSLDFESSSTDLFLPPPPLPPPEIDFS